jgi:hypothetical protein
MEKIDLGLNVFQRIFLSITAIAAWAFLIVGFVEAWFLDAYDLGLRCVIMFTLLIASVAYDRSRAIMKAIDRFNGDRS